MAEIRINPTIMTVDAAWIGEALNYNTLMPHGSMINPQGIPAVDKATLTVKTAVVVNAETIELTVPINNSVGIPSGMTLVFGAVEVVTRRWASSDATRLEVLPVSAPIAANAVANYPGYGARPLQSGIIVGRTIAERDAGVFFTLGDAADDELYILAFDVPDVLRKQEIDLVRPGTRIKENRLPGFASYAAGLKAKLRNIYTMYIGT